MKPLWIPSDKRIQSTNLYAFMQAASEHLGKALPDYDALHAWSAREPAAFWAFYAEHVNVPFKTKAHTVMSADPMPYTKWFEGASLNYAEALLFPQGIDASQPALIGVTEGGTQYELSYAELREQVGRCAAALKREGVGVGDRVAAFACNLPETTVLFLACASIGAVFSSCSPDFGLEASYARFSQIEPKLLFAYPAYYYGGKRFDTSDTIQQLSTQIPSISKTILIPYPDDKVSLDQSVQWEDWLGDSSEPSFEALPFDHPLYILFSSGTTGLPKAIVHRAGGALLKHHSEQYIHSDIKAGDRVFYFTTCGWMMWNWLVSGLAQGATIIHYEGSPAFPDLTRLWTLAEALELSFFGTSARFIHSLQAAGLMPKDIADLSALQTVASTGSPLSPSGFNYVYEAIKEDVHLASISGGTDIVGCFMLGVPTKPVYSSQIQGPGLGVDLVALNEQGEAVIGEPAELVCQSPLPSMPLKFWNDPDFERYKGAYFGTYEGKWRHGDLIEITEQGGAIVYGRSDATLNPGGVRIGTAEIYRPLESLPEVLEACAVAKREDGDEVIWLFVVLREGAELDDKLEAEIKARLRSEASPRHVPKKIIQVSQLPRTRSGKAMEIAVSRLVNGQQVPNREVMANPEAVDELETRLKNL